MTLFSVVLILVTVISMIYPRAMPLLDAEHDPIRDMEEVGDLFSDLLAEEYDSDERELTREI